MKRPRLRKGPWRAALIGVWALAIPLLVVVGINKVTPYKLILNHTASMPVGLYLLHTGLQPRSVGEIVVVRYQAPEWVARQGITGTHEYFIKRVGALPGAFIQKVGSHIYRCPIARPSNPSAACALMGVRKAQGFDGYTFPPIHFASPVPAGHLYLRSYYAHGTGFDSRYLGYFKLSQVMGLAYPLWTKIPPNPKCPGAPRWIVMSHYFSTTHGFISAQNAEFCSTPEARRMAQPTG